jgi:DNA-binding SARP family transcriptional activator/TolB-like protein/thioredoxin-like negative regulator of GroEL
MIDLRTLGALELTSADSNTVGSVLAQPRRAALLCYLALALPRGFQRRDALFALFWPEHDCDQARHALRQSVYFLRRALGPKTIVSRGDGELALAPDQVCCDVWAFEAAVDQGRPADALALYRGEPLAGFHISDAPDFERWLDQERGRVRQLALEAAWALAAAREREGDAAGAAEAARRAVAFSPTDETAVRRLIVLLQRLGDRVAAVRAYEAFAWKLEGEYELQPSAETRSLVESIRAESGESQAAVRPHRNGTSAAAGNGKSKPGVEEAEPSTGPAERLRWAEPPDRYDSADALGVEFAKAREPPSVARGLSFFVKRRSGVFAAGALLLALVGTADWRGVHDDSPPAKSAAGFGERERVLVADFDNLTADSLMGDALAQALRIALANSPALRVAGAPTVAAALRRMRRPPDSRLDRELAREVAVREGIRAVISGEVRKAGAGYVVSAALVEAATGDVVDGWWETAPDSGSLLHAIDRLSAAVRKRVGESLPSLAPGESLSRTTTSSLEALRRHAQAMRARRRGDFLKAADLFEEAIRLDSGFAQAYLGLGYALSTAGAHYSRVLKAHVKAFQLRELLTPPERYAVTANYYGVMGDLPREIEALRNQVEAAKPDREFVLYASLGGALASAGRFAEAEVVLREAREVYPTPVNQCVLVAVLYRRGKTKEAESVLREMHTRFPEFRDLAQLEAQMAAASGDYAAADSLATAAAADDQADQPRRLLAFTAAIRGRVEEASAGLRVVRDRLLADGRPGEAAELAVAIGRLRLARGAGRVAVTEVERFLAEDPLDSMDPLDRPYVPLARFYAEAGHPPRARQLVAEFGREVPPLYQAKHRGALERTWAAIQVAEGRPRQALLAIERAARQYPVGYVSFDASMIRLDEHPERARAYDRAGLPDSAIATYERFVAVPSLDRVQLDAFELPAALFRLAELYERRGARADAARYYLRFAELWKDADPALQPRVALARRRAAALGSRP